jgi:succinyl-diaminopimelate desuccinylase
MDAVERTVWLCNQESVTEEEAALAGLMEAAYRDAGEEVTRVGDSVVVGTPDERPVVLLVGHIDTVPPTPEDREARIEPRGDAQVIVGRGSSDMKAGVAVAESVFVDEDLRSSSPYGLVLVLYAREEGPAARNELADVIASVEWLRDAALAIVLEPTDGEVQLGCTGGIQAELTVVGRQAHSARPWTGESALVKAIPLLEDLAAWEPRDVDVDGITYRDVLSATQAWTENPKNVVPGRFWVNVNLRFAPSRDLDAAEQELRAWVGDRAEIDVVDRAPPAPPFLGQQIVERFVEAVEAPVTGKQGWTDVARFAVEGVPALNYGPGLTAQAHQAGEYVPVANIKETEARLRDFLTRG